MCGRLPRVGNHDNNKQRFRCPSLLRVPQWPPPPGSLRAARARATPPVAFLLYADPRTAWVPPG
eukprot:374159-Hanusia_phi.AAC.3